MISVENLEVEFAARPLFQNVSYVINNKDRIALVGKNGAGKSTMLKILAGLQLPTGGVVSVPKDTTIGYLPQVMVLSDEHTVIEEAEQAFAHISEMQARLEKMNNEMAERTDYESESYAKLVETFTHEQERFQMMGGMNYRAEMERTLIGLGFQRSDFDRPTSEFSGGWRMRIELAKLLLRKPDVLLLDEPTNHLDIESIQWLENFLATRANAVVLVSHDRAFINNVTTRTLEISCGRIYDYKVKYDEYVQMRAERREQQLRAYENQQKEIAEINDFIERFRYKATKAVQVQSRIKQLEKIIPIEVDEVDNSSLHLKFPAASRSGDYPLICEDVAKAYGDHQVFSDVNFRIKRGEKVAFVGKNGEGKSTLVKCVMGEIPFDGHLTVGHNVQLGYFAQNQAQLLDGEITVFDTIDRVAKGDIRTKIRDILGAFMFGGEASDKKVKVLSGGERSRLAMIKLLLEPVNFLILDEPTNHLDMRSKDVLKEAIKEFDGTVIVVSHDREFLDGLVDKVYEFGGGKVREHLGGIYDFLQHKNIDSLQQLEKNTTLAQATGTAATPSASAQPSEGKLSYEEQKAQAKVLRKLERAVEDAEKLIEKLETELADIEAKMSTPEGAADMQLCAQYGELKNKVDAAVEQWEKASEELEEAKNA
ncbi:ATP-binding cassette, subfamily F, member 3 [Bacteroidales bacterium KHT7]|nr:ABC-F family ATP-binding cassette domain-containing protein [Bacteroidaceae bacterium]MBQ3873992.1 ABC-F family ATP-binding cassette domain-containing protein [Bacteroidaceae bacterium]MBQ5351897.1 ABC-F family ATP-binding cassette domain-containing protein [Bacteroidaceae bacterium]MBQ5477070.1 ABC-F family ATP-binding cassette domain-containing protein [Bacteroidaceae bacterium]SDG44571.1 ATP-binding cassette, subfamily F, member 3 [Bacteroidales bacterium KHT7]